MKPGLEKRITIALYKKGENWKAELKDFYERGNPTAEYDNSELDEALGICEREAIENLLDAMRLER